MPGSVCVTSLQVPLGWILGLQVCRSVCVRIPGEVYLPDGRSHSRCIPATPLSHVPQPRNTHSKLNIQKRMELNNCLIFSHTVESYFWSHPRHETDNIQYKSKLKTEQNKGFTPYWNKASKLPQSFCAITEPHQFADVVAPDLSCTRVFGHEGDAVELREEVIQALHTGTQGEVGTVQTGLYVVPGRTETQLRVLP